MSHIQCAGITAKLVISARRKTLGLIVRDGKVTVRAPGWAKRAEIEQFIHARQGWLQKHIVLQQQREAQTRHSFREGDTFHWLGEPYQLSLSKGRPARLQRQNSTMHLRCATPTSPASVRRALEQCYKTEGAQLLQQRVDHFATRLKVEPKGIRLRYYRSRWGSCSHRGELQFNWLLLMAPQAVVDYVVVHELSHLLHFDHSPRFWRTVAGVLPAYNQQRQWLKNQTYMQWPEAEQ